MNVTEMHVPQPAAVTPRIPFRIAGGLPRACNAPVTFGVPLPRGMADDSIRWRVAGDAGASETCQTRALARWPDGSIKWLLVSVLAAPELETAWLVADCMETEGQRKRSANACRVEVETVGATQFIVTTGRAQFHVAAGSARLLDRAFDDQQDWLAQVGCMISVCDARGRRREVVLQRIEIEERGPIRVTLAVQGALGRRTGLRFAGRLSFFAGSSQMRVELTAQNPRRARHAGGYWDLGDPGSVLLKDLSLELVTALGGPRRIHWRERPDDSLRETTADRLEIYQDSSGGENWQGRNHVNRHGQVPLQFRGYRVRVDGEEASGERASPVVCLAGDGGSGVACALEEFWQQFPSAIETDGDRLTVRLWPGQFGDLHELQGGEHNTRVVWLGFGEGGPSTCRQLDWVHDSPLASVDPGWIASSGAVPFYPSSAAPQREELRLMLQEALEGPRNFFAKRETIDEYGWRNFGDVWADHEEAYYDGPRPIVSHYNNQYDVLHSFLVEFLMTGDRRWWNLADPLARHIADIDIYHSDRDKAGYSGGLFWHTAHYLDAGTCTHRSMSQWMIGKDMPAPGGGPGNEHNYASGLLLYHHLTGCPRAREAVMALADWVVAMDDGRLHLLSPLSNEPTGDASRTTVPGYHGPGRGAGNSINALLDGWLASGEKVYLKKIDELVRRTIHPTDDVAARDLGNAELRWSYTVYLQALFRFLELTAHRDDLTGLRAYCRKSLLRYCRWMAEFERFYLDEPEQLEFPTETWAAQELRKGNVLQMAAGLAAEEDAKRFAARGREILDRAWESLTSFGSRHAARPLALVLQQGYVETYLGGSPPKSNQSVTGRNDQHASLAFGRPTTFVEQKQHVHSITRSPRAMLHAFARMWRLRNWMTAWRQTWPAERLRRWVNSS